MVANLIYFLNDIIWSPAMLVLVVGSGIVFSIGLGFFQFARFGDMWKRVFEKSSSNEGISTFQSFCTTMAARIGTGNVAGVSLAVYLGGPGAIFWMVLVGITNSAVSFVECTLGQLYKVRIDGEYRGSGSYCAERGLGWRIYAAVYAAVLAIGACLLLTSPDSSAIADSFYVAFGIPDIVTGIGLAVVLGLIIIGGVKRIGRVAELIVPFMTVAYLLMTVVVLVMNVGQIPSMLALIVRSAFGKDALTGGMIGAAIMQGVKRGTFSSAAGMGESTPAAAAAETSHPVKQGLSNAAGVWLDTVFVCTATGLMILITDCFNCVGGYIGGGAPEMAELAASGDSGVAFVQYAARQVIGGIGPAFIAFLLVLFGFTCLINYYYEGETSALYLFRGEGQEKIRKIVQWLMRISTLVMVVIWSTVESELVWDAADLAVGICTWMNVIILWKLFPKARALYKDYAEQMKQGKDPYYNPDKLSWDGVDVELWREINKERIEQEQ